MRYLWLGIPSPCTYGSVSRSSVYASIGCLNGSTSTYGLVIRFLQKTISSHSWVVNSTPKSMKIAKEVCQALLQRSWKRPNYLVERIHKVKGQSETHLREWYGAAFYADRQVQWVFSVGKLFRELCVIKRDWSNSSRKVSRACKYPCASDSATQSWMVWFPSSMSVENGIWNPVIFSFDFIFYARLKLAGTRLIFVEIYSN